MSGGRRGRAAGSLGSTILLAILLALLAALGAAVWLWGPQVAFGETRPLGTLGARGAVTLLLAMVGTALLLAALRRRGDDRPRVVPGIAGDDPEGVGRRLAEGFARIARDAGPDLPRFLCLGTREPEKAAVLAAWTGGAPPQRSRKAAEAVELTTTSGALLLDVAPRLLLQDSIAPDSDAKSWAALLRALSETRPRRPLDGVVVAVPLGAAVSSSSAEALRMRLAELRDRLGGLPPVHLLFTGLETLEGFAETIAGWDEAQLARPWGEMWDAAPQAAAKGPAGRAAATLAALSGEMAAAVPEHLHSQRDAGAQARIFAFPARLGALGEAVAAYLRQAFGQGEVPAGMFFAAFSPGGGSVFLRDFLPDVLIPAAHRFRADRKGLGTRALRLAAASLVLFACLALLGAWTASFLQNRAMLASAEEALALAAPAEDLLKGDRIADADLENVVGALALLRDMPGGPSSSDAAQPAWTHLGLDQSPKLSNAVDEAYRNALERLFRTRLVLQVEQNLRTNIADPVGLYEPLKAYLVLGGMAPPSAAVAEPLVAYLKRDWEQRLYPGIPNRAGREELETHLRAMLALGLVKQPVAYLDRQLLESGQRSLARMDLEDQAWAIVQTASYGAVPQAFSAASDLGPQAAQALGTLDGRSLSAQRIPGLYTYAGFRSFFLPELSRLGQRVVDDQWVMGAGGQQVGVEEQLKRLGPALLNRYAQDFIDAWSDLLGNLRLKPLTADKPDYATLAALASVSSPLRMLVERIARETGLTEEDATMPPAADADVEGLARIGIAPPPSKSQGRAGGVFGDASLSVPGAAVAEQFEAYRALVSGPEGRRPADALVQNFREIHQSLTGGGGGAGLQLQVHNLRANASRLPPDLRRMVEGAAEALEGDVAETSLSQLDKQLNAGPGALCRELLDDAYPFAAAGSRDLDPADFARLFAPGGEFDRFFAQNLASLADIGKRPWQWRKDSALGRDLSPQSLTPFERAAELRDAFFPGGATRPAVEMTITPAGLHEGAERAVLDLGGSELESRQAGNTQLSLRWPDGMAASSVRLALRPELPGRQSSLDFAGAWAIKRLFDAGTATPGSDGVAVRFVLGGRDVSYLLRFAGQVDPGANPFTLRAFSELRCPEGL